MQGTESRTQTHPPVYAVPNQNKSHATRTEQVLADFKEYRRILGDVEKRVKALEAQGETAKKEGTSVT